MKDPFLHADNALNKIKKQFDAEFNNLALRLPMDELNLPQARKVVDIPYSRLKKLTDKALLEICKKSLNDADALCETFGYKNDIDFISTPQSVLKGVLGGFNRTTGYSYEEEWKRKQDRTIEALIAFTIFTERRKALDTARSVLWRQVREYGDIVTDSSMLESYKRYGVKKVVWVGILDEKICNTCFDLDGNVYDIDSIPALPQHWNCRCYVQPITTDKG